VRTFDSFLVINRDEEYLLGSALSFAKEHKMEESVARLLDIKEWEKRVKPAWPSKKRKKKFVGTPAHDRFKRSLAAGPPDFAFSWREAAFCFDKAIAFFSFNMAVMPFFTSSSVFFLDGFISLSLMM